MGKSIRDVMSSNPCAIDADKPVAHAAKMMKQEDVGLAPVVEGDRLVGTLTDRDIVLRVVAEGKDPQTVTAREVASTDLVTIDPQQDLEEALRLMASKQVRRLPVVEEGRGAADRPARRGHLSTLRRLRCRARRRTSRTRSSTRP